MKVLDSWIHWIGLRYIRSKRRERAVTPSILSIGGITVGVMTLTAVLSVMNGLQLGFIEDILEINSYHIRIEMDKKYEPALSREIGEWKNISSAAFFFDTQTLIQGEYSEYKSAFVRAIEESDALADSRFMDHLEMTGGSFDLSTGDLPGLVIGDQLAFQLGVNVGDVVRMVSMKGNSFASLRPQSTPFLVNGIFHSGYYQYDATFCFIDLGKAELIDSTVTRGILGVKLKNRFRDGEVSYEIEELMKEKNLEGTVKSWREYNRSFFRALRVEKLTMMMLLGLIFLVVAVNIKHSLERSVMERKEEIGILRALGADPWSIRKIFLVEGGLVGMIGSFLGLLIGLLLSININSVFHIAEKIINGSLRILRMFSIGPGTGPQVNIMSQNSFYLQEVPTRVLFSDLMIIVLFALLTSLLAAFTASRRISEFKPAEILRNE